MDTRCADHVTPLYPQKLALTSPTGGGRSVGIVRSRTKATEFSLVLVHEFASEGFPEPRRIFIYLADSCRPATWQLPSILEGHAGGTSMRITGRPLASGVETGSIHPLQI